MTSRRRDEEPKIKKHVSYRPATVEKFQAYADRYDLSFSAVSESLGLLALEDDRTGNLIPVLHTMMDRMMARHFNRLAKVMAFAAIEAGSANRTSSALLLQKIREQAQADPANFWPRMQVSQEGRDPVAREIRRVHQLMKDKARYDTVQRLRQPLAEIEEIVRGDEQRDDDER